MEWWDALPDELQTEFMQALGRGLADPGVAPPIPLLLTCPACGARHVDKGEFAKKPHHTHACQSCGMAWRPALVATVGVQFLPGFKDAEEST